MAPEKLTTAETPAYIKEIEDKNATLSDGIYRYLLESKPEKPNFIIAWHHEKTKLQDGRELFVNAQALIGIKTFEEVKIKPDKGNVLRIAIGSSREGSVGYVISEQIANHQIDEYTISTGPEHCLGVERDTDTARFNIALDYNKVLSLISKKLKVSRSPTISK